MYNIAELKPNVCNWVTQIKNELFQLGLGYIWLQQNMFDSNNFLIIYKTKLMEVFEQECINYFSNSPKCFLYQFLNDHFCLQSYLKRPILQSYKKIITKFRLASHSLYIETGRYNNIPRNERYCTLCSLK